MDVTLSIRIFWFLCHIHQSDSERNKIISRLTFSANLSEADQTDGGLEFVNQKHIAATHTQNYRVICFQAKHTFLFEK